MSNSGIVVGLDVGSSITKVIVAEIINGEANVIGSGAAESYGVKKGSIGDIDKVAQSIKEAANIASRQTKYEITDFVVGIPNNQLEIKPVKGSISIEDETSEVSEDDIADLAHEIVAKNVELGRTVSGFVPGQFSLDNFDEIEDPRGMVGVNLEMSGTLYTSPQTLVHSIVKAVQIAGFGIKGFVVNSLSLDQYVLNDGEQDFGAIVIDMGAGQTTASIMHDHKLKYSTTDLEGGINVTKDISTVLNTSIESAEKIKREYGNASESLAAPNEAFKVNVVGQMNPQDVSTKLLAQIIQARDEQIFKVLGSRLDRIGGLDFPGGIILTGGNSSVPGTTELAHQIFKRRVKQFIPDEMGLRQPEFSQVLGIVSYQAKVSEVEQLLLDIMYEDIQDNHEQTVKPNRAGERKSVFPKAPKKRKVTKKAPKASKTGESISKKAKSFLGNFFE